MKKWRFGALAGSVILSPLAGWADDAFVPSGEAAWKASSPPATWQASKPTRPWSPSWLGEPTPSAARELLPPPRAVTSEPATKLTPAADWQVSSPAISESDLWRRTQGPARPARPEVLPPVEEISAEPVREVSPDERILPPESGAKPPAVVLPPTTAQARPALLGRPGVFGRMAHRGEAHADPAAEDPPGFLDAVTPQKSRLTVRGEYLNWWARNDRVPALATTGTGDNPGVLGQAGTQTLLGPGPIDQSHRQGARFYGNLWLDDCQTAGLDGSFFFLPRRQSGFVLSSANTPVIARPVFNLNDNREDAEIVAFPGFSTGNLGVQSSSQFWGADANILKRLCSDCTQTVDVFFGYRYLYLSESVQVTEDITAAAGSTDPAGTRVLVQDRFATRNYFHGGQAGLRYERRWDRFFANVRGGVALGVNRQTVDISGFQSVTRPGETTQFFSGGLLTASSNIGRHSRDRFSVVPDLNLNLGYQFTPHLRGFIGYSFIYWSNVVRPGDQIDRSVDLALVPNARPGTAPTGLQRPGVLFNQSDFWVQGVSFGLEWVW